MTTLMRCFLAVTCVVLALGCQAEKPATPNVDANSNQGNKSMSQVKIPDAQIEKGGGSYEVRGEKKSGTDVSIESKRATNEEGDLIRIEIDWPVTKDQFEELKKGMSTFRVKNLVELSKLDLEPKGSKTQFQLVCKNGNAKVTLVFAGKDVELESKSSEGLN